MKWYQTSLLTILRWMTALCLFLGTCRRAIFNEAFVIGFHDGFLPILWLFNFEFVFWKTTTDNPIEIIGFGVGLISTLIFTVATISCLAILLFGLPKRKEQ